VKESIEGYTVDTLDLDCPDWGPPNHAVELAARVKAMVDPWHQVAHPHGISLDIYDQIISEALSQLAKDIRCGKRTEVEYLGTFQARDGVLTTHTNRDVTFDPEPLLIERWPVALERVA
jgi:hypothetical protein